MEPVLLATPVPVDQVKGERLGLPLDSSCPPVTQALASDATDLCEEHPKDTVKRIRSQAFCGRGAVVGWSEDRSCLLVVPVSCKSWDCPRCGPRKRGAWTRRLAEGKPNKELTLTTANLGGCSVKERARLMGAQFYKLVQRIRKRFGRFEYALTIELTKRGVPHMHVLARCKWVPQKWLSDQWNLLNASPIVHIRAVEEASAHAAHVTKYLGKDTGQTAAELAPLKIVRVSKNWDLPGSDGEWRRKRKGWTWGWTPQTPGDVVEEVLGTGVRVVERMHGPDQISFWFPAQRLLFDWVPMEKGPVYEFRASAPPLLGGGGQST